MKKSVVNLPLLCRATRPTLLANTTTCSTTISNTSTRPASLSAIHAGLRKSEKARPQGYRTSKEYIHRDDVKPLSYRERAELRAKSAGPGYKIRKGKKDITEYENDSQAKSRKARFFDPESSHGKKSLVYKLKTGQLDENITKALSEEGVRVPSRRSESSFGSEREARGDKNPWGSGRSGGRSRESGRGSSDRSRGRDRGRSSGLRSRDKKNSRDSVDAFDGDTAQFFAHHFGKEDMGPSPSRRSGDKDDGLSAPDRSGDRKTERVSIESFPRRDSAPSFQDNSRNDRPRSSDRFDRDRARPSSDRFDRDRARPSSDRFDRDRSRSSWKPSERSEPESGDKAPLSAFEPSTRRASGKTYQSRDHYPISIPYTTAASQFLYGKSVVQAALTAKQRKLYKLYLYKGENRLNIDQDEAIARLAKKRGVEIVYVGPEGLRLLDKMSQSRPHNGYVLEASPLAQLPLLSLGPVSEDPSNPGYKVEIQHQSAEEEAINGASDFIPTTSTTHKPLVVVLDQVLDPGNLGAILRTVSFLGATAVAITKRSSAKMTPVALKASAGASEAMQLFSVENLIKFLADSKENGWHVYAAVPKTSRSTVRKQLDQHEVEEADPLAENPCILLIGSEGEGLAKNVKSKADFEVSIPNMSPDTAVDSLNVSVATGLLCSSFMKGQVKAAFSLAKQELDAQALF